MARRVFLAGLFFWLALLHSGCLAPRKPYLEISGVRDCSYCRYVDLPGPPWRGQDTKEIHLGIPRSMEGSLLIALNSNFQMPPSYDGRIYAVDMAKGSARAANESEWQNATKAAAHLNSPFHPAPDLEHFDRDKNPVYRGNEYKKAGRQLSALRPSPDGSWLVVVSGEETRVPQGILGHDQGSLHIEIFRVATGDRIVALQGTYFGLSQHMFLSTAVWLSDRHFAMRANAEETKLLLIDLGPARGDRQAVFDLVPDKPEFVGFREQATHTRVHGVPGSLGITSVFRLPELDDYGFQARLDGDSPSDLRMHRRHWGMQPITEYMRVPRRKGRYSLNEVTLLRNRKAVMAIDSAGETETYPFSDPPASTTRLASIEDRTKYRDGSIFRAKSGQFQPDASAPVQESDDAFVMAGDQASFTPIDRNGDGLYELLKIRIPVRTSAKLCQGDNDYSFPFRIEGPATGYLILTSSGQSLREVAEGGVYEIDFRVRCGDSPETLTTLRFQKTHSFRLASPLLKTKKFQEPYSIDLRSQASDVFSIDCHPNGGPGEKISFFPLTAISGATLDVTPQSGLCVPNAARLTILPSSATPKGVYYVRVLAVSSGVSYEASTKWSHNGPPRIARIDSSILPGSRMAFRVLVEDPNTSSGNSDVRNFQFMVTESSDPSSPDPSRTCLVSSHGFFFLDGVKADRNAADGTLCRLEPGPVRSTASDVDQDYAFTLHFKPAFKGEKRVFVRALDVSDASSGWQEAPFRLPPSLNEPPLAVSVSPYSGAGQSRRFTFTASDRDGNAHITRAQVLFRRERESKATCRFILDRSAGSIVLMDETGVGPIGSVPLGSKGAIANSRCSLRDPAIVEENGRAFSFAADVQFTPDFSGRRNIYLNVDDRGGASSGWEWVGTWMVGGER